MRNLSITENIDNSMDLSTREAYIAALDAFTDDSEPDCLTEELENLFKHIARTGDTIVSWDKLKKAFILKLKLVIDEFNSSNQYVAGKINANCENEQFSEMKESLISLANGFEHAPFTFQRVCELIINPKQNYTKCEKYMRALEKNLRVVTSWSYTPRRVSEPGSLESQMNGSANSNNTSSKSPSNNKSPLAPTLLNKEPSEVDSTATASSETTNHVSSPSVEVGGSLIDHASDQTSDLPVPIEKIIMPTNTNEATSSEVETEVSAVPVNIENMPASTAPKNECNEKEDNDNIPLVQKTDSLVLDDKATAPAVAKEEIEPELASKASQLTAEESSEPLAVGMSDNSVESNPLQTAITKRKLDSENNSEDHSIEENSAKRPKNE